MRHSSIHRVISHNSIRNYRAFDAIFNNFRYYTEMSCYLVPNEEPFQWFCLQPTQIQFGLRDYEDRFGLSDKRNLYNQANFKRMAEKNARSTTGSWGFMILLCLY